MDNADGKAGLLMFQIIYTISIMCILFAFIFTKAVADIFCCQIVEKAKIFCKKNDVGMIVISDEKVDDPR